MARALLAGGAEVGRLTEGPPEEVAAIVSGVPGRAPRDSWSKLSGVRRLALPGRSGGGPRIAACRSAANAGSCWLTMMILLPDVVLAPVVGRLSGGGALMGEGRRLS